MMNNKFYYFFLSIIIFILASLAPSAVLAYPKPQKVTATSESVQIWEATMIYHLEFWNVGALDQSGQYSQARVNLECTQKCGEFKGSQATGTFSGGPNGTFIVNDVEYSLLNGKTITASDDGMTVTFTVNNPEAFDGDWNEESSDGNSDSDRLPKEGVAGGLVRGTAKYSRDNGETYFEIPADGPATLRIGDVITTGPDSRFLIKYPDGSILKIKSNSKVTMLEEGVQIVYGETFFNLKKQGKKFHVVTYQTFVGVLGTAFSVSHTQDTNETTVDVMEGRVEVTLPDSKELVLNPGDRYAVNDGGYDVTKLDNAKLLQEENALTEQELSQAKLNDGQYLDSENVTNPRSESTSSLLSIPVILAFIILLTLAVIFVIFLKKKKS